MGVGERAGDRETEGIGDGETERFACPIAPLSLRLLVPSPTSFRPNVPSS
jgi:hypothetical protein